MINVIKIEIDMDESLKKRLKIICDFCNTTPTIINDLTLRVGILTKNINNKDKLFGKKEREKYFDVSKDLYKKALLKKILSTN